MMLSRLFVAVSLVASLFEIVQGDTITTFAGVQSLTASWSGDGGPATSASLANSHLSWMDSAGLFYEAEFTSKKIRTVSTSGIIQAYFGSGSSTITNGAATAAGGTPYSIFGTTTGVVYFVDFLTRIRKIDTNNIVSDFAGGGSLTTESVAATSASFSNIYVCLGDTNGDLYALDSGHNKIKKLAMSSMLVTTYAGTGSAVITDDSATVGDGGQATSARVYSPISAFLDTNNMLYFNSNGAGSIRKIDMTSGIMSLVAGGTGTQSYTGDYGPATAATLQNGVSFTAGDSTGNVYYSTYNYNNIRYIDTDGIIGPFAGTDTTTGSFSGDGGDATAARFNKPRGMSCRGNYVYVADYNNNIIRAVTVSSKTNSGVSYANTGSVAPTVVPTVAPSMVPTVKPTELPSVRPSFVPTVTPTVVPTVRPTLVPTAAPSTAVPTVNTLPPSALPTLMPSIAPTEPPTVVPSAVPTLLPTVIPTVGPTVVPSIAPSMTPTTTQPSVAPTVAPTVCPSVLPTIVPTAAPSIVPTVAPTVVPSVVPSSPPSGLPTLTPSALPSVGPTLQPTTCPSFEPSLAPTVLPSVSPSAQPTVGPSNKPTEAPSVMPTQLPSVAPTVSPSAVPTAPTLAPSVLPTIAPSVMPSVMPSMKPTTLSPTWKPSKSPTVRPSRGSLISASPTMLPSAAPTESFVDISFDADIYLHNVTSTTLDSTDQSAVTGAVSNTLEINSNQVTLLSQELIGTEGHRRQLTAGAVTTYQVLVSVNVWASTRDFEDATNQDGEYLYKKLSSELSAAVKSNEFSATVRSMSAELGAVNTLYVGQVNLTASYYSVVTPTVDHDHHRYGKLSNGDFAGIVIGIVIVTMGVMTVFYCALFEKTRSGDTSKDERKIDV